MMIEIDDDCLDTIVAAELISTYKSLKKDLKNPEQWHEDDLEAFQEVLKALDVVGPFYVHDWKKKVK
jgi:hypothetical protein